jgi:hypothetical protein
MQAQVKAAACEDPPRNKNSATTAPPNCADSPPHYSGYLKRHGLIDEKTEFYGTSLGAYFAAGSAMFLFPKDKVRGRLLASVVHLCTQCCVLNAVAHGKIRRARRRHLVASRSRWC